MKNHQRFPPAWVNEVAPTNSYRSLFKWGYPDQFKHPNSGLYSLMKETFGMSDADFQDARASGFEIFQQNIPSTLPLEDRQALETIVGCENVSDEPYYRTRCSYGAGMMDALRLRRHVVENLADLVVSPQNKDQVEQIVQYCHQHFLPLYVFGGGSSVTRGTEAVKGGISLDLSRHLNKVVSFNEIDQTITVQAGMSGPQLEELLNDAPNKLSSKMKYTCGHFPQSFMHSSVGGWVVTRGAGQNSTYYGKIEDMVLSQLYITPRGVLRTPAFARCATGPDFNQLMMGSEGSFGVLTEVTLKLHRFMPENTTRFSYLFHSWEDALAATRAVMQGEFGLPSVYRLSDPEETDVAMRMYHIHGSPADTALKTLNYLPGQRCLLLGSCDGQHSFTRLVNRKIRQIAAHYGAFNLSPFRVTQMWEKSRFLDPYLREDLMDFGILIDTLECAVTWNQLPAVHQKVRSFVKSRPQTICMTHLSHSYPQGTNLYFIFIARIADIDSYLDLQYGVLQAIQESGAAMSHHHGIGKQTGPWLEGQIGTANMDVIRTLKAHFDPHNVMNPGGTLGLDMSEEQAQKRWGKSGRAVS